MNHVRFLVVLLAFSQISCQQEIGRLETDLSDLSWSIWIDSTADWENDTLYLPPVDLSKVRSNPPGIGWDKLENPDLQKTGLPATVEQYFWDNSADTAWGAGDYSGVSWFTTTVYIPTKLEGKLHFLDFESVRLRAEVYVNKKLAGYDCIGNTPFRVEISDQLIYGAKNQIAIRITDPGGNYYWEDYHLDRWGEQYIPPSHGFGGITGQLRLLATDRSFIDDIFIENQPETNKIRIRTTLQNLHPKALKGKLRYSILEPGGKRQVAENHSLPLNLDPGKLTIDTLITIPDHQLWSPEHPRLYTLEASWENQEGDADNITKKFGLRWFESMEVEGERSFYLNKQRIFLTSAISWGFWPDNGIFPSPELAEKQVRNLKILGLNMFNFHRAIGQSLLFDQADEQGILVYEEPGGYRCPYENIWFWKEDDPSNTIPVEDVQFAWQWRREKLFRMIKRDRSHPSLVLYNMGNEMLMNPDEQHKKDMADAHLLDPSRHITFSSHSFHPVFFPEYPEGECPNDTAAAKLFMKPGDHNFHYYGWWDNHHALGEGSYRDSYYNGPDDYRLYSNNRKEIVFYGEEGAIHAPPRLDSILPYLDSNTITGWDSEYLRLTQDNLSTFLKTKGFDDAGLSLQKLLGSFANNAYYYHGEMIENCRLGNHVDAYVINGLEDPKRSFCSGILDIYRNIKGDATLLSAPTRPQYLAIKPYCKVFNKGEQLKYDIFIVNDGAIKGDYLLEVLLLEGADTIGQHHERVSVSGGNLHGELLAELLKFDLSGNYKGGYLKLEAGLYKDSKLITSGKDRLFLLPPINIPSNRSIMYEGSSGAILSALNESGAHLSPFSSELDEASLLVVTTLPAKEKCDEILNWVGEGNHLVVLSSATRWASVLDQKKILQFKGVYRNNTEWSAGGAFNQAHPIFRDLPSGGMMGWEYQDLTNNWKNRHCLILEGEQSIVGAFGSEQHQVGTAMGEVSHDSGTILLNTLDFESALQNKGSAGKMSKALLGNMEEYYSNKD